MSDEATKIRSKTELDDPPMQTDDHIGTGTPPTDPPTDPATSNGSK